MEEKNIENIEAANVEENLQNAADVTETEEKTQDAKEVLSPEEKKRRIIKETLSWVKIIVIAVVIAVLVNSFLIINANVPSGSMENTIMTKSRMIGLRTAYWFSEPQRGDIAIFKFPDDESQEFVKRVIGLPGETVTIKDAKIYINNSKTPLEEPYLKEEWVVNNGSERVLEYKVPKGCYFMLGDNRNSSHDARNWVHHYVKESKIDAKAEFVYWPFSQFKGLKSATYSYDKNKKKNKK